MVTSETYIAETVIEDKKLLVAQRMARARAAKAYKRINREVEKLEKGKLWKAGSVESTTQIDNPPKSIRGKAVHIGERGAKFYINVNGNRTYLSSNQ